MINLNSMRYCTRQTVLSLLRNIWLAIVTSCIIAVSLAILGTFLLVAVNAGQLIRNIESNVEIVIFLHDEADVAAVENQLLRLDGVRTLTFIGKDEGLEVFSRSLGDSVLLEGLKGEENPLPDVFRARAAAADAVPALAGEIRGIPGVELVDYGEELVGRLIRITGWLNKVMLATSLSLAVGAVFLIITTVRLSVMARLEEISIMKYLGASDWYIRLPFLLEGMVIGWVGTLVATGALGLFYFRFAFSLQQEALAFFVQPVTALDMLVPIFAGLILLGTLMGGVGSLVSVRKFLRV